MAGPWDAAVAQLREWDPAWAETCIRMATNPWRSGLLARKLVELIGVAMNAACTNLNPEGTRRHIRSALEAGATRAEVLMVLKMASLLSIHSCSLGAPILLEEGKAASARPKPKAKVATPACDQMKTLGQWNAAWDPFYELDPAWTDEFMATGAALYAGEILPVRDVELLSRLRRLPHPHVRAGHAASHSQRAEGRRHLGGNHGGAEALRRAGRAGMQPWCSHSGGRACTASWLRRHGVTLKVAELVHGAWAAAGAN